MAIAQKEPRIIIPEMALRSVRRGNESEGSMLKAITFAAARIILVGTLAATQGCFYEASTGRNQEQAMGAQTANSTTMVNGCIDIAKTASPASYTPTDRIGMISDSCQAIADRQSNKSWRAVTVQKVLNGGERLLEGGVAFGVGYGLNHLK